MMGSKMGYGIYPSKCQVLHITRARAPIKTSYTMHNQALDSVLAASTLVSIYPLT